MEMQANKVITDVRFARGISLKEGTGFYLEAVLDLENEAVGVKLRIKNGNSFLNPDSEEGEYTFLQGISEVVRDIPIVFVEEVLAAISAQLAENECSLAIEWGEEDIETDELELMLAFGGKTAIYAPTIEEMADFLTCRHPERILDEIRGLLSENTLQQESLKEKIREASELGVLNEAMGAVLNSIRWREIRAYGRAKGEEFAKEQGIPVDDHEALARAVEQAIHDYREEQKEQGG